MLCWCFDGLEFKADVLKVCNGDARGGCGGRSACSIEVRWIMEELS